MDTAEIIIIGAGVIGCSIAYHSARRDCKLVLELQTLQSFCLSRWKDLNLRHIKKSDASSDVLFTNVAARLFHDLGRGAAGSGQEPRYEKRHQRVVATLEMDCCKHSLI